MSPMQAGPAQIWLIADVGDNPSYSCLIRASFELPDTASLDEVGTALKGRHPSAVKAAMTQNPGSVWFGALGRMLDNVLPLIIDPSGTGGVANRIVATDFAVPNSPARNVTLETQIFLNDDVDPDAVFTLLRGYVAQKNVFQIVQVLKSFGEVTQPESLTALVAAALNQPFP
jgi:hypothetical protein